MIYYWMSINIFIYFWVHLDALTKSDPSVCWLCNLSWVLFYIPLSCRGPRKVCLLFCIFHLLAGIMKSLSRHPSIWITSLLLALSSSVFFYCFETWMVNEHEKVWIWPNCSTFLMIILCFLLTVFFFVLARSQTRFAERDLLAHDLFRVSIFNWKPRGRKYASQRSSKRISSPLCLSCLIGNDKRSIY